MAEFTSAQLEPFLQSSAATILSWVTSQSDLFHWAAREDFPFPDTSVFEKWHADSDVRAYKLLVDNVLLGYGEIWHDSDDNTWELARLLIAPASRNKGLGELLILRLVQEIEQLSSPIWVRVFPSNHAAIGCYQKAGFARAPRDEESRYNANQPHSYIWMSQRRDG